MPRAAVGDVFRGAGRYLSDPLAPYDLPCALGSGTGYLGLEEALTGGSFGLLRRPWSSIPRQTCETFEEASLIDALPATELKSDKGRPPWVVGAVPRPDRQSKAVRGPRLVQVARAKGLEVSFSRARVVYSVAVEYLGR